MKSLVSAISLSSIFFIIYALFFSSSVVACSNVSVSPAAGVQGTPFSVTASNCGPLNGATGYGVFVYYPDGDVQHFGTLSLSEDGTGGSLQLGVFNAIGSYTVEIYLQDDFQTSTSFQVTEAVDTPPPTDEAFNCGDVVAFGAPTCSDTLTTNCCPQACPSQANPVGSGYVCLVRSNVPTCAFGNGADEYGVPSAVGCIPYSDANQFTIFASRWLASIAGGIALLLICISAILYMTSQGNPDRLGEAKNISLAAITGLLLILLAIILFRVSVEVLGLF